MNNISMLTALGRELPGLNVRSAASAEGEDFSNILSDAIKLTEQADVQDKASTLSLLTGEADDIAGLMIDAQKSQISLSLTVQLRNKLMESYNEIINMQV